MRLIVSGNAQFNPKIAETGVRPSFEIERIESIDLLERFKFIAKFSSEGQFLMAGERADTLLALEAMKKDVGVIIFEAHVGALFAAESGKVTHDFFLKHAVECIPGSRMILVGVHDFLYPEEFAFLKQHKIQYYSMKTMAQEGMHIVCDAVMEIAKDWQRCYVSIGLDVLDPAFAHVEYPSPGGLTTRELFYFIQRLRMMRSFFAADVYEWEKNHALAERLLTELAVKQN